MRVPAGTRRARLAWAGGLSAVVLVLWGAVVAAPSAADPRLEGAVEERERRQAALDEVLSRIDSLEALVDDSERELAKLSRTHDRHQAQAEQSMQRVVEHVRASYMHGRPDPVWAVLVADDPGTASQASRLLAVVAEHHKAEIERALATAAQVQATADRMVELVAGLEERQDDLEEAKGEAAALLAEAEQREANVRAVIHREQEEARRRREARERAARAGAALSGDIACPVARPHSFTNTYGAARSGGRAHRGTDILAPRGTHIYAYEAGTISRMGTNRLGGIVLYLRGDSGNTYYYAHLQGYVGGVHSGQRVRAGQHIAYNGDTGNARGIPHLHIEVQPGGRGNVNPYPFMRRACG